MSKRYPDSDDAISPGRDLYALAAPLMPLGTHQKITLVVGAAAFLPLSVAVIGLYGTQRLLNDVRWVSHTHDVRTQVAGIARHIDAAKGDIRGFLLTGDSAYLRHYAAEVAQAEGAFDRAQQLSSDNPAQRARYVALREQLTEREVALQQTLALPLAPPRPVRALVDRLATGQALASRIDSTLDAVDSAEARLLSERSGRASGSEHFLTGTAIALALFGLGFALLFRRSINHDLTGRALAEANLRASEAKFAGILDIAVDAVITIDERRSIVHFNRSAEETFGYDRTDVVGERSEILLPERHRNAHVARVREFATAPDNARRLGERRDIVGRRKDGSEFPAEVSISRLATPDGHLLTAVLHDVTESRRREHHEHALALAGAELTRSLEYEDVVSIVARLPVPSVGAWCVLDVIERKESGETVIRRVAGAHADEGAGAPLADLERLGVDWNSPEPAIDVLGNGRPLRLMVTEDWLEGHVPSSRHLELMRELNARSLLVVPILGRDGATGAWTIGSSSEHAFDAHDASLALALAERAAAALENARLFRTTQSAISARDNVLGIVSHDLRNPLSAISMLARRLVDERATPEVSRSVGMNILISAEWMNRMIRDLLDLASIDAGRLAVDLEPVSATALVEACLQMFVDQAAAKHVKLVTALSSSQAPVMGDGDRLVQVLGNLVGNALRFTPEHGTIEIGAHSTAHETVFWVRDFGSGIPVADVARVFDRFWEARRAGAKRGHGLGLAIAEGIVRAHGGRIWVESVEKEGSTFFFSVPLASRPTGFALGFDSARSGAAAVPAGFTLAERPAPSPRLEP